LTQYDVYETDYAMIADMLTNDLVLGWVSGKYEIGPRALGNRSILAAPFQESTSLMRPRTEPDNAQYQR
jgi:predicted NodU family carbamoyl transferase